MKIKSITKRDFNGWVYNFHCLPNENYFSEGVLVHNCYKSNTSEGKNMSFETFKTIFDKINGATIQIELEDGNIVELKPSQKVELVSGNFKVAEDLAEEDEINLDKLSIL